MRKFTTRLPERKPPRERLESEIVASSDGLHYMQGITFLLSQEPSLHKHDLRHKSFLLGQGRKAIASFLPETTFDIVWR